MKQPITVKTTVDTLDTHSSLPLPKGTTGRVVGFRPGWPNDLVIDFGLSRLAILPTDSHLITIQEQE